jgi:serine-type D-Ala-D-Ala carboxypeptidase/endopeptidase (penicillin-binding protein 4)
MGIMSSFLRYLRFRGWAAGWALAAHSVWAQTPPSTLPETVLQALAQAKVPASAMSVVVAPVHSHTHNGLGVQLRHRATESVNPASIMKLVTTLAALETLGPGHVWQTRVYTHGPIVNGTLQGSLYLQGGGDPKLVSERLWLLLHRVRGLGIERIAGDIILDRSVFDVPYIDPGAFDGEPLRPYNASPDGLLVNFKSQLFTFVPDAAADVARIVMEPPMAGVQVPATVPLGRGGCGDWRTRLQADWSNPLQPRFAGRYPASCGERLWPLAHPEPNQMTLRAVLGVWQSLGGQLQGRVRDGRVNPQAELRLTLDSPPLAEVVRDVNKFSNNVMAQHLLLSLGLAPAERPAGPTAALLPASNSAAPSAPLTAPSATFASGQKAIARWWAQRLPQWPAPLLINGAGLSRDERITADAMAALLQAAYASPMMPDFVASLPASGLDGTLRRSTMGTGLAHLKTGSLRDVYALAGYVHNPQGQRYVLVAIINHPNANAARPALERLVQWVGR